MKISSTRIRTQLRLIFALGTSFVPALSGCGSDDGNNQGQDSEGEVSESGDKTDAGGHGSAGETESGGGDGSDGSDSNGGVGGSDSNGGVGGSAGSDSGGGTTPPALDENYGAGSRLKPNFLNASDGAKQFDGWYDAELKTTCRFTTSVGGIPQRGWDKAYCLPPMLLVDRTNFFENNTCDSERSKAVDVGFIALCDDHAQVKYARVKDNACGNDPEIYKVESTKAVDKYDLLWQAVGDKCPAVFEDAKGYVYVTLGERVELSSFVSATHDN